jgi:hypothetical protein
MHIFDNMLTYLTRFGSGLGLTFLTGLKDLLGINLRMLGYFGLHLFESFLLYN